MQDITDTVKCLIHKLFTLFSIQNITNEMKIKYIDVNSIEDAAGYLSIDFVVPANEMC